ncbi:MAG TPA: DMT family transporter [Lichenihabitans sp.]|jgi:transporter family-2 protein|nr:DMT family transporter [Lichenihabitans sp.]
MTLLYSILAFLGGAFFPVQTAINAQLGRFLGGALPATIVSFLVGTIALALLYLVTARSSVDLSELRRIPPYLFVGGLLGAAFLGLSVFLIPRIGAGALLCLAVAGQIATSMIVDYFGLFGLPVREPSLPRLAGAALMVIGVILVRFR